MNEHGSKDFVLQLTADFHNEGDFYLLFFFAYLFFLEN